ncbi:MAG TPA: hypothetical protein PKV16_06530 [Caldisericia bacterium]|nr:hypothetical protein [Caldisericia bacterium]HPF48830.1 hypothetical protein [Caldisericia bacterium]HPI84246.1 hypothetical protein [Caldisericia bacterium]HPQ93424.1 hypothetical protein [Caldisericia bacterium]HRV74882.1 hypothetical protein [Caldisericia bacterium]
MPGQIPMGVIVDKVIEGIGKAQRDYMSWSNGYWLSNAPEYMITTSVARSISTISKTSKCWVILENNVKETMCDASAGSRGCYHSNLRADGKFDIVACWADETPRAVIELKHNVWSKRRPLRDISRLKEVLRRNSGDSRVQFCVLGFYIQCCDKNRDFAIKKLNKRINRITDAAIEEVGEEFEVTQYDGGFVTKNDDDEWVWEAVALVIRRKSTESS